MASVVRILVVFFLAFNLFAGMLATTGIDAMLGIDSTVGEDSDVQQLNESSSGVDSGSSEGGTLFGLRNALGRGISSIFGFVFPGLTMLERAGVPNWITQGFLAPIFGVMITVQVISFLRGYDV